ncbi:MAG: glycosyltransferase family 39 protein [Anaerolineales bacterium]|jgi:hypothetical protein
MPEINKWFAKRNWLLLAIMGIALLGGVLIFYGTAPGPYGASDAVSYLVKARNFAKGIGIGYYFPDGSFFQPTIQEPLYSIVLGLFYLVKIDLLQAARLLDILFFVATIFLAEYLFYRYSSIPALSIIVGALIGVFPALLEAYTSVLTESLYFVLYFGSLLCLVSHLQNGQKRWLIFSALLAGLLATTRYDGLPIIAVELIFVFLVDRGTVGQRLRKTFVFGLIAAVPFLIWVISIHFRVSQSTLGQGATLSQLPIRFQQFRVNVSGILWSWIPFNAQLPFVKERSRSICLILVATGMIFITLLAARSRNKTGNLASQDSNFQIFSLFASSLIASTVFLIFTYLFFSLPNRLDARQLLPVYASAVGSALGAFCCWQKAWFHGRPWMQVIPWLVAGLFFFWYLPGAVGAINLSRSGTSSLSTTWKDSALIKAVQALPKNTPIVSNGTDVILLWADRPSYDLLGEMQASFLNEHTPYGSDPNDRAQVAFRQQGAALVVFGGDLSKTLGAHYGYYEGLRGKNMFNGLVVAGQYPDGTIYFYPK